MHLPFGLDLWYKLWQPVLLPRSVFSWLERLLAGWRVGYESGSILLRIEPNVNKLHKLVRELAHQIYPSFA
nr:hypothetical protein [Chroococcidiopsis cubana]